jgi:hypothetical protein
MFPTNHTHGKKSTQTKYRNDGDMVVPIGMGGFGRGEVKILFGDEYDITPADNYVE